MRNVFFYLLPLFPTAVVACTVSANVGDFPSTLDAGSEGHAFGDGSGPASDGAADADGTTPFVDAGCGIGFAQQGSFIDVQSSLDPQPQYSGGTIVAGVYVMTSMTYYSLKNGTAQRRETLNVRGAPPTGAFERIIEQRNPTGDYQAVAAHAETSTWMVNSPFFLDETLECPSRFAGTGDYTATGDTLTIFTGGGEAFERVYRRVP